MIAIGLTPVEEELFDIMPKEPIAKYSEKDPEMLLNGRRGNDTEVNLGRINRIVLSGKAIVEYLDAKSPSEIWVRIQNHITDSTLTIREPYKLEPIPELYLNDYVLAPYDERVFRRARIIDIFPIQNRNCAKILFIDDATTAVVNPECLCEMPEELMFYPWQAIQISMIGIFPGLSIDNNSYQIKPKWSQDVCDQLCEVLKIFPYLKIEVVLSSVNFNDYSRPLPCRIYGVGKGFEDSKDVGVDLTSILIARCRQDSIIEIPMHDAAYHKFFEYEDSRETGEPEIEEIHQQMPLNWKHLSPEEEEAQKAEERKLFKNDIDPDVGDWDPANCQIPAFSKSDLEKFADENGIVLMAVEGNATKSPYVWFARPIMKTWSGPNDTVVTNVTKSSYPKQEELTLDDEVEWMMRGNEDLVACAEELDTYYSNTKNRKPLLAEQIKKYHSEGLHVYAICAVSEERAAFTGEWQRVEILNCNVFASVRYLDSGGHDMVLTSSLYKIHKQHCRYPPKCLQLALHGIRSSNPKITDSVPGAWNALEVATFKTLLREDTPLQVHLNDSLVMNQTKLEMFEFSVDRLTLPEGIEPVGMRKPYQESNVFFVRDVTFCGETKSLLWEFHEGQHYKCGIIENDMPMPWNPVKGQQIDVFADKIELFDVETASSDPMSGDDEESF
ncbi:unnamed protein product [Caenorhabditis bovis]|uniref:Tudor domain-containing protein n=1 Tax=Caenorhabditis bovis TaxID=2654633 RepID=A0A8S1FAR2_9PELO|nr:unnamed protein product [Caenorhabditis bovis]